MGKSGITPLGEIGKKHARIKYWFIREIIGEFIGTVILLFMIVGSNAQFLIKSQTEGESQVVPVLGTILGIMIAIQVTGGVAGAHLNPALSIAQALHGDLSWYSLPGYFLGQSVGAVVGSLLAWSIIHPSIRDTFMPKGSKMSIAEFDESDDESKMIPSLKIAGIFGPVKKGITLSNGISTEIMETFLLIIVILAACDKQSSFKPPKFLLTLWIPLSIAGLCFSHDIPTGTVMNPVRDLGPRVAAWILGWKGESVFMNYDWDGNQQHWWLVGLFGPILGAVLAVLVYAFILGPQVNLEHLEEEEKDKPPRFPDDTDYSGEKKKEDKLEAKRAGDPSDWRSTVFVPKPHVIAPVTHVGVNNQNHNNNDYQINYPNGNNGYVNHAYQNVNRGY